MDSPTRRRSTRTALTAATAAAAVLAVVAVSGGVAAATRLGGAVTGRASYDALAAGPRHDWSRASHDELMRATPDTVARETMADRGAVTDADRSGKRVSFRLTTFNVLGSQHTGPGGDELDAAPGRIRTEWATDLLNSYGSSIVGLQEAQLDQVVGLVKASRGTFDVWPGSALGAPGVPQSLIWKSAVWQATYRSSITVPFVGRTRPQPVVRLRNRATGRQIYVINVHNSPKDRHGREAERNKAEAIEIATVKELRKDGLPLFIVGDFNEHGEVFCRFTGATSLVAAQGGSNGKGGCKPPKPARVDWIFGAPAGQFSQFRLDESPFVRRATDHSVSTTLVSLR